MGSDHYRVLYRRSERLIVLLHVFPKRTGKLPRMEVKIAEERWEDSDMPPNQPLWISRVLLSYLIGDGR
jgi:Gp49-like protein DUF891